MGNETSTNTGSTTVGSQARPADPLPSDIYPQNVSRIGDTVAQPNSCTALRQAPNVCYRNGEFTPIAPVNLPESPCCVIGGGPNFGVEFVNGGRPCSGCPSGNSGNCIAQSGAPVNCRLTRYLADPTRCAFEGRSPQTGPDGLLFTCDPDWLPGGSQNSALRRQFCSDPNNLLNDERCQLFCNQNDCTDLVLSTCRGNNLDSEGCRNLCFSSQTPYDCSQNLTQYCQDPANHDKNICQCFLPTNVYRDFYLSSLNALPDSTRTQLINQLVTLPTCSYPSCATSNLRPRNEPPCPPQAICIENIDFNAQGVTFKGDVVFNQNCKNILGIEETPTLPGCNSDVDCQPGQQCVNSVCVSPSGQCKLDADCQQDQICVNGNCLSLPGTTAPTKQQNQKPNQNQNQNQTESFVRRNRLAILIPLIVITIILLVLVFVVRNTAARIIFIVLIFILLGLIGYVSYAGFIVR